MSKLIYLIAGEASGDVLGAALMRSLKEQSSKPLDFVGIGGDLMVAEGLKASRWSMADIGLMGLVEIIKHIPRLLGVIRDVAEEIESLDPVAVITIDVPDFSFRVCKRLKKRKKFQGKLIHYVAPTVWAWRAGRAAKVAKFLDGLICLFPFEPPYFEAHGLKARFCGHPLIENDPATFERAGFRQHFGIKPDVPVLGVLFGSRHGEVARHGDLFIEAVQVIRVHVPHLQIVVPTLPHLEDEVRVLTDVLDIPVTIISRPEDKWHGFAAMDAALCVSGTVGLELAYAAVPHVIAYRFNWLTHKIAKRVIKTPFAHLANVILQRRVVPELIQDAASVVSISNEVSALLRSEKTAQKQRDGFKEIHKHLCAGEGQSPSQEAAQYVLDIITVTSDL